MAQIITVANTKGGVGKSHLAVNLAVYSAILGHKVLLVDGDPQATSAKFASVRDEDRPAFMTVEFTQSNLHKKMGELSAPYDYVFIDVGGRDAPVLRSGIGAGDIILVPLIASPADSWAADDIFEVLDQMIQAGLELDVRVLVNMQTPGIGTISSRESAESVLKKIKSRDYATLLQTQVGRRTAWPRSFGEGLGVGEWESAGSAAVELYKLAEELGIHDSERTEEGQTNEGE